MNGEHTFQMSSPLSVHNNISRWSRCWVGGGGRVSTHSETTSDGKVWGTDRTFSHRALSLVQVHPTGHLGCRTLRPSAGTRLTAATHTRSVHPFHPPHPPLTALPGYPIPSVPVEYYQSCTMQLLGKKKKEKKKKKKEKIPHSWFFFKKISLSLSFSLSLPICVFLFPRLFFNDRRWCRCARMQTGVYASCVSMGKAPVQRIRSARKAGLQMRGQTDRTWEQRADLCCCCCCFFLIMKSNYLNLPSNTTLLLPGCFFFFLFCFCRAYK